VSLVRLYIDEDSMSHALFRALRSRNVDVTTALESGMIEREDQEHLQFAALRIASYTPSTSQTITFYIRHCLLKEDPTPA